MLPTLLTLLAAAGTPAVPEALPRGQVVENVACLEAGDQAYALYLPASYTPERTG